MVCHGDVSTHNGMKYRVRALNLQDVVYKPGTSWILNLIVPVQEDHNMAAHPSPSPVMLISTHLPYCCRRPARAKQNYLVHTI